MRKCKNCLKIKKIEKGETYCPVCNFTFDSPLKDKVKIIERSVFNLTNNILKMYDKRKIESNK